MIAIIDYGVGNLFSLKSSFSAIGKEVVVTNDSATISSAERILLPGVGAFEDASKKLTNSGLADVIKREVKKGKPLMGICLGMQLLFDKSYEYGEHAGLGLIQGAVCPIAESVDGALKIPHIGWNSLIVRKDSQLLKYVKQGDYVYFAHSYYATQCEHSTVAVSHYGVDVPALVEDGNIYGCQFHPEKSGEVGLHILKAFSEL